MTDIEIDIGEYGDSHKVGGKTIERVISNNLTFDGLTGNQIQSVIDKVMNEPNFRRGFIETQVYIWTDSLTKKGCVNVSLGLFDYWDETDEDGGGENDSWGNSPIWEYKISDL